MQSLEAALADKNTADNLNLVVTFFNSAGLYQEALTLLETHHVPESLNPILKTQQTELLNYLMQHQKELVAKNMQTSS
jgi:DNA-binding winged helix-turn-helix (wHTH) protein